MSERDASTRSAPDLAQQLWSLWQQGEQPDPARFLAGAGEVEPAELVAVLRVDQHERWRRGERVPAEAYLERFPALAADAERAVELIYCEYLLLEEAGERPAPAAFVGRFPRHADRLRQQLTFHGNSGDPDNGSGSTRLDPEDVPHTLSMSAAPAFHAPSSWPAPADYALVRELGRGGMGVVYEVFDRRRGRRVALKTMQAIDPAGLLRFKQEFRSLAGLSHPNLVALYELVGDGPRWFYTMELVEGVPFLRHVRASAGPPPAVPRGADPETLAAPDQAPPPPPPPPPATGPSPTQLTRLRDALAQLAAGVHFLHQAGKLHRDIKPGNVLVTRQGRVVLLDFGLAAELDRGQRHRSVHLLGTVAYMAPEQAACQPVSPASDWYSVGVMLYEALTGRLPIDGPAVEILLRKQQEDPPPPGSVAPGVPPDLDALCVELLRRSPEGRPGGDEVLQRLLPGPDAAVPVTPPRSPSGLEVPLIGRRTHLEALAAAFAAVRQGRPVTVLVHGRSGAGKSALVRCFLDGLAERGEAVVLSGRCYEQESVPYKAWDSLVDSLSRYLEGLPRAGAEALLPRDILSLARVFPVLRRLPAVAEAPRRGPDVTDPQEVRRRGLAALRELLARLGDRRPLVLAIDDLQWGDSDSAALLADLLRPPDPPLLLLVGSYRSEDAATSPCLRALRQAGEGGLDRRELAVEPLTEDERRELALALLAPRDQAGLAHAEAIARQSGGYPFFVYELVQYLQAGTPPDGEAAGPAGDLTLSEVLWQRVCRLPAEARRLLEVVAVAGRPLRQADACAAAGLGGDDRAALLTLRAGRLLRGMGPSEGGEVETYHDRIRETVVARLDPDTLRGHHDRLARVLEAAGGADPEVLAIHWQGAGEPERAGGYYALAAEQAAEALAFARAANLYRRALDLNGGDDAATRGLRMRLGDALANAGRGAEAARVYLELAGGATPAEGLELQRRAALQLLCCGHVDAGLATLRTVLDAVGLTLPTPRRALVGLLWQRLKLWLRGLRCTPRPLEQVPPGDLLRLNACGTAAIGLSLVDPIPGAYFQALSVLLALRAGEPLHLAQALAIEAAHVSVGGGRSRRRTARLLRAAEEVARGTGQPYPLAVAALGRGIAAALAGDWRQAVEGCELAETVLRENCAGVMWELGTAYRFGLWPRMFMGDVAEIARRLPVLLKEARERDDRYTMTNLSLVVGTFTHLAADEPARARDVLQEVMAGWSRGGFHVQHMNRLYDETQIDLYTGDGPSAWRWLTAGWESVRRSFLLRVQQVRIFMRDLRARSALAAAAGAADPAPLLRAAAGEARALRRERMPWAGALARLAEAGIAAARGDLAGAASLYGDAADRLQAADMHLYAAAARRRRGQLLGGPDGNELLARAETWMTAQGVRSIERMTALLAPLHSRSKG
jgi:serine/threonine protein kinase